MIYTRTPRFTLTRQAEIRSAFWTAHPHLRDAARWTGRFKAPQNEQPAHVREAFCDFLDGLHRSGRVSDDLASRATL